MGPVVEKQPVQETTKEGDREAGGREQVALKPKEKSGDRARESKGGRCSELRQDMG